MPISGATAVVNSGLSNTQATFYESQAVEQLYATLGFRSLTTPKTLPLNKGRVIELFSYDLSPFTSGVTAGNAPANASEGAPGIEKVVNAILTYGTGSEASAVGIEHDWTLAAVIHRGGPDVEHQAIFATRRLVLPISGARSLHGRRPKLGRIAHSRPGRDFRRCLKAIAARNRPRIGNALKSQRATAVPAADSSAADLRLHERSDGLGGPSWFFATPGYPQSGRRSCGCASFQKTTAVIGLGHESLPEYS
jgi:hypothetical protein